MTGPVGYLNEITKLKQGLNESKSRWVKFPNGKTYLLPVITRHQKMKPVFEKNEAGVTTIKFTVEQDNKELADLVDQFMQIAMNSMKQSDGTGRLELALNTYGEFIQVLRGLLLTSYDFNDEELSDMLTFTSKELNFVFHSVLEHIKAP